MSFNLKDVPRVKNITKGEFVKQYLKPQKPVVIEGLTKDWPAYKKWDLEYIRKIAGDKIVPLYDNRPVNPEAKFNAAHTQMKMSDYIDLLKKEPTNFRIFLWNILKEVPQLQSDFSYPDFGIRILKKLPMLFFGGKDSYTFMHYDIDLANIFHFHFQGVKKCILFDQKQSKYMYKIPNSLITREDIDFNNPDFKKWPALKHAKGYITDLKHGDVLYMPEGYWHYMRYITAGFSMSLRAIPKNPKNLAQAVYNILIMRSIDNVMRSTRGKQWMDWKKRRAIVKTHKKIGIKV